MPKKDRNTYLFLKKTNKKRARENRLQKLVNIIFAKVVYFSQTPK